MNSRHEIKDDGSKILDLVAGVIEKERQLQTNPFLAEKVMGKINQAETPVSVSLFFKALQFSLIAAGIALVILAGISLGSVYTDINSMNVEVISINDAFLERIDLILTE